MILFSIFLIAIGFIFLVFGISSLLKVEKSNSVSIFELGDTIHEFHIKSIGDYFICIIGAGYVEDATPLISKVYSSTKKVEIPVRQINFKKRFRYKGKMSIVYSRFHVEYPGIHNISFDHLDKVVAKKSMLASKRVLQSKLDMNALKILIKKAPRIKSWVIPMLFCTLGVLMIYFGLFYYLKG